MTYTYTSCYYVQDDCSGSSEWTDESFKSFSECLTHVLQVLRNPEDFETPEEGVTIPDGMSDSEGDQDYWYSSQLRLERGLFVCKDNSTSFRPGPAHEQLVPLPLKQGDTGSAYGWPEQVVREGHWTLCNYQVGNDYYASHSSHTSLAHGLFQLHARQKGEENTDAQWYLISAFAPGAGGFSNNPSALVEGPLCIRGDASQYESSRRASLAYSGKYNQ